MSKHVACIVWIDQVMSGQKVRQYSLLYQSKKCSWNKIIYSNVWKCQFLAFFKGVFFCIWYKYYTHVVNHCKFSSFHFILTFTRCVYIAITPPKSLFIKHYVSFLSKPFITVNNTLIPVGYSSYIRKANYELPLSAC